MGLPPSTAHDAGAAHLLLERPRLPPVLPSGRAAISGAERRALRVLVDAERRRREGLPTAAVVKGAAEERVLDLLRTEPGPLTRLEVAERCGLGQARAGNVLRELERGGFVSAKRGGVGRRSPKLYATTSAV